MQSLNIKKNYSREDTVTTSYLSFKGTNFNFNLSLTACIEFNCTMEREYYRNQTNNETDPDPTVTYTPVEEDLSVFIYISASILGVILCTVMIIFGIKRYTREDDEEKKDGN